jgi:CheY-like chemotaxis protein
MMKNVLLIDDERETAQVFETGLSSAGFSVVVASDGAGALDAVKTNKFDVILIDQMMPDMSGIDVLRALKADEGTKNIPCAMLTNFGHDEMVKEALNLGANDYILKYQVAPSDLVAKVKRLVGEQ